MTPLMIPLWLFLVWPIPLWLRLVLVALGLCSYSIASLIYREHPLAFMAMLAALPAIDRSLQHHYLILRYYLNTTPLPNTALLRC